MDISEKLVYTVDLAEDTVRQTIRQPMIKGDKKAHTIQIIVQDHGIGTTLTSCTAQINCVRSDGETIATAGAVQNSVAEYTLIEAMYECTGKVDMWFSLTSGTSKRTLLWLTGYVV